MHDFSVEIFFLSQRFHDQLLQVFGKQGQPVLVWKDHHIFVALAVAGIVPHERQKHCRIVCHIRHAGPLVHGGRASEKTIDIEAFQRHREKPHRAYHRGTPADPIVHRESSQPFVPFGNFIQIAPNTGDGHCVFVELQSFLFESCFRLQHPISCLLCSAGFGNHNNQRLGEQIVDPVEDAIEPVRVRIIEEKDVHWITCRPERVCHQLRSKRRAADPDQQRMLEAFSIFGRDSSGMNIFGEFFDALDVLFNFRANFRSRRKRRIAEPVMTHHPVFGGISDRSRFQFSHRRERLLDFRLHFLEKILRKFQPADVERKIKIAVVQKISLEALPKR